VKALQVECEERTGKEREAAVATRWRMTFATRKEQKEREREDATKERDNGRPSAGGVWRRRAARSRRYLR